MTFFLKYSLIVLLLLTGFQYGFAATDPEVSQLEKFYYEKCLRIGGTGPQAFEKLRTDVYELYKYFQFTFTFLPKQRKLFCDNERSNLIYRIKEVEVDLNKCLARQEQFFSSFLRKSFEELLHFFCHNDGEYTKRAFNVEATQCIKTIEESKSTDLENCLNRIFPPSRSYITQSEICDDVTVARKCFKQLLEIYCPTAQDFQRLNGVFFDYIGKPCAGCSIVINNFMLIGFSVFLLLKYFR